MIVCPHCNHQNPDEAIQCEACYTPLPTTTNCPNCGAPVQTDATFCGQCGFNLKPEMGNAIDDIPETIVSSGKQPANEPHREEENAVAPTVQSMPDRLPNIAVTATMNNSNVEPPEPVSNDWKSESDDRFSNSAETASLSSESEAIVTPPPPDLPIPDESETIEAEPVESGLDSGPLTLPELPSSPLSAPKSTPTVSSPLPPPPVSSPSFPAGGGAPTRLQIQIASLFHVQTQTRIELPYTLAVIHLGKPNEQIPPDVDVSGFPDSEIVSRIHADIRVEGDIFYIEDMGSSNGTYINHTPLSQGNRHRLRSGDRISLGKGDRVTFIFQLS